MNPIVRMSRYGVVAVLAVLGLLVVALPGPAEPPPAANDPPKKAEPVQPPGVPPVVLPGAKDALKNAPPGSDPTALARYHEVMKQAGNGLRVVTFERRQAPPPPPLPEAIPDGPGAWAPPGYSSQEFRLGARITKPSETLTEQLELPKDQGVVIEQVNPDSPAAKAGLKAHDILLELDGKSVSSDPGEFAKAMQSVKADKPVEALVLRRGRRETLKGLTLPETKPMVPAPALRGQRGPELPALPPAPPIELTPLPPPSISGH